MDQAVLVGLHNEEEIIHLKGPEFTLGRGLHNSYVCRDLTVSRCHCIFNFDNNKWSVLDRSSNGTLLNSKPLSKSNGHPLQNNDILQLNDFIKYKFCYPYNANKRRRVELGVENNNTSETVNSSSKTEKKNHVIPDYDVQQCSSDKSQVSLLKNELCREKAIIKKLSDDSKEMKDKIFGLELDLFHKISSSVKLEEEIKDLKKSCNELQEEKEKLQAQLARYESETNTLKQKLEIAQALRSQIDTDDEDKRILRSVLRAEINEKESIIKSTIYHTLYLLKSTECKDSLLEKIQTDLSHMKTEVDELITKRNELDSIKSSQPVDKEEKIKEDLFNIMEADLQCSICNEIFVKATSLNCGHTFCKLCIEQWKKQKNTCPVCRVPIKNILQCIAIDNYVDQTIDLLSPNKKEIRAKLKETHEASVSKLTSARSIAPNRTQTVYISSESDSESDEWDTEDFSDYSDGYYYGGYGSCYICGGEDHWANACPQRRHGADGIPRRR